MSLVAWRKEVFALTGNAALPDAILSEARKTAAATAFSLLYLLEHAIDDLKAGRSVGATIGYIYTLRSTRRPG